MSTRRQPGIIEGVIVSMAVKVNHKSVKRASKFIYISNPEYDDDGEVIFRGYH